MSTGSFRLYGLTGNEKSRGPEGLQPSMLL